MTEKPLFKFIKERRLDLGYSQQEVGDKLFLDKQNISYYENAKRNISIDILTKLSEVLNFSLTISNGKLKYSTEEYNMTNTTQKTTHEIIWKIMWSASSFEPLFPAMTNTFYKVDFKSNKLVAANSLDYDVLLKEYQFKDSKDLKDKSVQLYVVKECLQGDTDITVSIIRTAVESNPDITTRYYDGLKIMEYVSDTYIDEYEYNWFTREKAITIYNGEITESENHLDTLKQYDSTVEASKNGAFCAHYIKGNTPYICLDSYIYSDADEDSVAILYLPNMYDMIVVDIIEGSDYSVSSDTINSLELELSRKYPNTEIKFNTIEI